MNRKIKRWFLSGILTVFFCVAPATLLTVLGLITYPFWGTVALVLFCIIGFIGTICAIVLSVEMWDNQDIKEWIKEPKKEKEDSKGKPLF